jgi:UDP-N-acetylglucosamine diphosphorylase / glucose-1-phosphate thymidylyltransferase / UDP-N-acetylgalactosamine diphosphorylase / glucosamine-1-phosphate N-acetyltransferase / galactosamine-1-phosphate N-acetyltransferase
MNNAREAGYTARDMTATIVFDDGKGALSPLTDLRAAFDVRTGALTTLDRFRLLWRQEPFALFVPPEWAVITKERHPKIPVNEIPDVAAEVLIVNGRYAAMKPEIEGEALTLGSGVLAEDGSVICARVRADHATAAMKADRTVCPKLAEGTRTEKGLTLISRPWHVRSMRDACLAADLAELSQVGHAAKLDGVVRFGEQRVSISPGAKVYPGAVLDAEHGPIVIAEYAVVRPRAILIGPCYVGPYSTVLDQAVIRQGTSIGPWCKMNGEVSGTIVQGYTNKAHDGFLGDSWLGEWVNLGAGTTNSNLLNTYGEVIAVGQPGGSYERTGEQFLGVMIGDHVKTAICTRIMTGSVLHMGSMFAMRAAVAGCVRGFTWATDAGSRPYRLDKFMDVVRAAMSRRKITPSEAYVRRLAELHAAAQVKS